jgi:transposase
VILICFLHKKNTILIETTKLFCGIDIASATIEVCIQKANGSFYNENLPNSSIGFKKLQGLTKGFTYHYVMESTGIYHLSLCVFLEKKHCLYSVVNPLQVKRYIQMQLETSKSDKKDAKHICMFGIERNPEPFNMPEQEYFDCRSINNSIETYTQEITLFTNKIHALKKQNLTQKIVLKSYQRIVRDLKKERKNLEIQLNSQLQKWQPELVELVSSVIGIGQRATSLLIITTQGFKYTESYQQLISFVGLNPKEYTSGSSIRGRVRISKLGHSKLRNTLYMCSLNAMANNPFCKDLYDRLVAKGKNKKVALIAVCTKLLKLIFGVVKSGVKFNKNYKAKTV